MPPVLGPVSPSPMRLWSCAGTSGRDMGAVVEAKKADLFAFEEFLDDDLLLGRTQQPAIEQPLRSLDGGGARGADQDAFAGGQPVGFDHDRRMEIFDFLLELGGGGADRVGSGGNLVALQKALGEGLAGFEHGGFAGRSEDAETVLAQSVDDAEGER